MKNVVDDVILSFNKEELREFKYFLSRSGATKGQREDVRLVEQIRAGSVKKSGNNVLYQTRKRLKASLEQFALLENLRHEESAKALRLVEMAKYLFRKNLYQQAWAYLAQAEKLAEQAEEYQLLDTILDLQIAYSYNIAVPAPEGLFVPKLLQKRRENRLLEAIDSNTNAAYAQLIYEIREQLSKKLSVDVNELSGRILKDYHLEEGTYRNNIRIYCRVVNMICRILREKGDYIALKDYGVENYEYIETHRLTDKVSMDFFIELLDTISVAAIRSKDYVTYEQFINLYALYAQKIQAHSKEPTYYDFIPYIDAADLYMCTNRLEEAKQKLGIVEEKYINYYASPRIFCLLRTTLMALYFKCCDYSRCIHYYQQLSNYDPKKILNERGFRLEIILYTKLYGILFYYEDGDYYYADYLLKQLKRKYGTVLKSEDSSREILFVKIMDQILNKPGYLKSKKFIAEKDNFINMKEYLPGDWEYISLNAWLEWKSKHNTNYYECYLQAIGPR